ncbi:MAG: Cache 3/Cache 2 fusion domain-containing protein [Bacteroidales bacterium]|nr:Cache 3/Cache 2 fusion domain-containing protein [Bacteroidales bacterium]
MFKKMKIGPRLYLLIGSAILIIFTVFTIYLENYIAGILTKNYNEAIQENLMNFEAMVKLEARANLEKTIVGGNLAGNYFKGLGKLAEHPNDYVTVNNVKLAQWTINGQPIQNSYEIVDAIKAYGVETATIFQRFKDGYIRVSTNVMDQEGKRAIGTHIGWDSPVVQAIEKGERFQGRAWVVDRWYVTDYQPIIIDGTIKGILYVGNTDVNYNSLSQYFNTKSYFGSGYPYIVDKNGILTAHPNAVGTSIAGYDFFKEMLSKDEGKVVYEWEGKEKTQFFKFIPETENYITVGWYTADFNKITNTLAIILILASILAILGLVFIVAVIIRRVVLGINKTVENFETLANGDLTFNISQSDLGKEDELGQLARSGKLMQDRLREVMPV